MMASISLLVALLVTLQCTFQASAHVDNRKRLDNNILPNAVPSGKRRLGNNLRFRSTPPETVQLEPGSRAVLKCTVIGKPAPKMQWLKNGEPVDFEVETNDILPVEPSSIAEMVSKLVVSSAVSGDIYTCVATSGLKRKTASTTVYTLEGNDEENLVTLQKLFRMPAKPLITTYYTNMFQNMGTDVVLPCRLDSSSEAQLFWHDNNDKLVFENSRMRVLPSGDLLISLLRWTDMGNYTCMAKNAYGSDVAETFIYPLKPKKE